MAGTSGATTAGDSAEASSAPVTTSEATTSTANPATSEPDPSTSTGGPTNGPEVTGEMTTGPVMTGDTLSTSETTNLGDSTTSTDETSTDAVEDTTGCMVGCEPRVAFVTKVGVKGNFAGLAAVDSQCNSEALEAGLSGTFLAWISDGVTPPADRFDVDFAGDYVLPMSMSAVVIANGWQDLTDGTLDIPINANAGGNLEAVTEVWSGVTIAGESVTTDTAMLCNGWTMTTGTGPVGSFGVKDPTWTDDGLGNCGISRRFYCFEDKP